jgi:hypothetical protein
VSGGGGTREEREARRNGGRARTSVVAVALLLSAACGAPRRSGPFGAPPSSLLPRPSTRAERTSYTETSRYADVVAFLDSLRALDAPMRVQELGKSPAGRSIPLVVASRPLVRTAAEARRLGRPVVCVQANIHAGEVEGKEALQALLRDLALAPGPNVLDSIVLLAVPIYNADGNERVASQAVNRTEQNGPELVGERANGQGLDLNRDYVKGEAPETRAALTLLGAWDPDVFVDLHTTDGSYHGYALTYAPSLNPAAPLGGWTRDELLPELRRRMRARHGIETFDYGNFSLEYGADVTTDTVKQGWYSYDHRPRFGTNYYGLRGGVAILSEAYSHDPFARRVRATRAFVDEVLSLTAARGPELLAKRAALRRLAERGGPPTGNVAPTAAGRATDTATVVPSGRTVPIRSVLTRHPYTGEVVAEDLAATRDSSPTQPGVPHGLRRTGHFRTLRLPVHDHFEPVLLVTPPAAYALGGGDSAAVRLLRLHGVEVERLTAARTATVARFAVDSVVHAEQPFQGHHETRVVGRWSDTRTPLAVSLPAGSYVVRTAQPLGLLAVYLLEPESDDGLTTWNVFDGGLHAGGRHPVLQLVEPLRTGGP